MWNTVEKKGNVIIIVIITEIFFSGEKNAIELFFKGKTILEREKKTNDRGMLRLNIVDSPNGLVFFLSLSLFFGIITVYKYSVLGRCVWTN